MNNTRFVLYYVSTIENLDLKSCSVVESIEELYEDIKDIEKYGYKFKKVIYNMPFDTESLDLISILYPLVAFDDEEIEQQEYEYITGIELVKYKEC